MERERMEECLGGLQSKSGSGITSSLPTCHEKELSNLVSSDCKDVVYIWSQSGSCKKKTPKTSEIDCDESDKAVFCFINNVTQKAPEDGSWLPVETTS